MYGMAAVLTVGIVPWTILAMSGTNERLIAVAEGKGKEDEGEVGVLLGRWTALNGVRSLFPLLGSVVAVMAVLG
jgi:hypothetical protein